MIASTQVEADRYFLALWLSEFLRCIVGAGAFRVRFNKKLADPSESFAQRQKHTYM